ATYSSDLNSLIGSCPWPGPWFRAHGAHLVYQVEGMKQSFTALAAPPLVFLLQGTYAGRRVDLISEKTTLRAQLRGLRRRRAAEAPDAAARAAALLPLDALPAIESFSGYFALGAEID